MPKTAKRSSTSSLSVTCKCAAADPAPQHAIEDLPRKIRHLGGLIQHLQNFSFELDEEDGPEATVLAKTIKKLFQQFGRLQDHVFATPVQPGDIDALRARAEIAQFWWADEIALCPAVENSEAGMLGELIRAILSYCEVNEATAPTHPRTDLQSARII